MLRPYAAALGLRQLGPRQGLRRLHVRLVECVDSQTGAQLLRGVLPRHELRAQREGIGGELAHDLTVGAWRREWVINDGDDAASAFAGALRHQLLDPVGQPRHRRGGAPHQPVPPPPPTPRGPPPPPPRGGGGGGGRPPPPNATPHAPPRGGAPGLAPPIPHTTVWVRPSRRAASAKRTRSSHWASETRGAVLQARWSIRPRNLTPSRSVARTVRLATSSLVPSLTRQTRTLVAIAAGSFLAIVLAYLLAPADRRALVAGVSWTWAMVYAIACCAVAARRHGSPDQRRAWVWIGAGCVLFLAGELVWSYYELIRRVTPPYPSLADVGFLGVYVCFLVAVTKLVGAAPRRRFDRELLIDTVLVTLTAGALAYEFLLKPLFDLAGNVPSLLTSLGWSVGGIGVLWLILVELLRHTRVPLAAAGVVTALGVLCVTNVLYAAAALRGTFRSGGVLDLGWDAGLLLLAAAAALAPAAPPTADAGARALSGNAARIPALVIGLAGIGPVAIRNALSAEPDAGSAVLIALSVWIIVLLMIHSNR